MVQIKVLRYMYWKTTQSVILGTSIILLLYLSASISLKVLMIVHAQIMKSFFLARDKNPSVCTFYIL